MHLSRLILLAACFTSASAFSADAVPAAVPGESVFSDDFQRTEVGAAWKTSLKSFRIEDGILKVTQMNPKHGAVGAIQVGRKDCIVDFKFRFEGCDSINAVFDDKNFTGSHAGHICRIAITPKQIRLGDDKEGVMRPDIMELRKDPAKKAQAEKLLEGRGLTIVRTTEPHRWYQVRIVVLGDQISASIDGQPVGTLKSSGIGHENKTHFHFTVNGKDAWLDDVQVWAVAPAAGK